MEVEKDDGERNEIRDELSKMSFEDLQKLKEKLGSKVYNEAMFGTKNTPAKDFKRENKNRPREVSSKKAEPILFPKAKKPDIRDPRFDSLCGTFDDRRFQKDYKFLENVRSKEKAALIEQLKSEEDPQERRKVKSVLQRLKNKEKEEIRKKKKEDNKSMEMEEKIQAVREGRKPYFRSKLESKVVGLVEQYSELKKKGKLQKHIEKQRKRLGQCDRKSGFFDET